MTPEHLDVLIVGAGLSGIGAAAHLQDALPERSYALLEAREASGGTWDLFRYPGIRSDSDMHTLGSGATAVTLVPAMTDKAAHVTMLQRSPTYIVSLPGEDPIAKLLRRRLSPERAYAIVRWKNVLLQSISYRIARRRPGLMKKLIRKGVERQLPAGYDIDTHFKPAYNPWDQRMCLVPDGDLFVALTRGTASVVTDGVDT